MRNRKGRYLQPRRPPHASRVQIRLVWTAASVATLARTRTSPGLASSLVTHIPFLVATPSASTISLMPPTTPNPYTTQVCAEDPYEVARSFVNDPGRDIPGGLYEIRKYSYTNQAPMSPTSLSRVVCSSWASRSARCAPRYSPTRSCGTKLPAGLGHQISLRRSCSAVRKGPLTMYLDETTAIQRATNQHLMANSIIHLTSIA